MDELFGGYHQFPEGVQVDKYIRGRIYTEEVDKYFFGDECRDYSTYAIKKDMQVSYRTYEKAINLDDKFYMENRRQLFYSYDGDNYDKHLRYEISNHLHDLLIKQDRMAMANGIENRVPFLSNDIVEFALTMPKDFFIREYEGIYTGKYVLKDVCSEVYGKGFAYRKKMGFPHPIKTYLKEYLSEKRIVDFKEMIREFEWVNYEVVSRWLEEINELNIEQTTILWKLLNLGMLL